MMQKNSRIIDTSVDLVYTIKEIGELLMFNKKYVYVLKNEELMRSTKLGCRKVTRKALIEFLEENDGLNFDEMKDSNHTK